jgi:predicted dehydrogenase
MTRPLRFGLVGAGHWARITGAPALAATDGIDFAAVWGRDGRAAGELADRYHAAAYDDIPGFLAKVDATSLPVSGINGLNGRS